MQRVVTRRQCGEQRTCSNNPFASQVDPKETFRSTRLDRQIALSFRKYCPHSRRPLSPFDCRLGNADLLDSEWRTRSAGRCWVEAILTSARTQSTEKAFHPFSLIARANARHLRAVTLDALFSWHD